MSQKPWPQRLVAAVPWGHHLLMLNKLTDPIARLYYIRATAQSGRSRNVLLYQIKAGAYERARSVTQYPATWSSEATPTSAAKTAARKGDGRRREIRVLAASFRE